MNNDLRAYSNAKVSMFLKNTVKSIVAIYLFGKGRSRLRPNCEGSYREFFLYTHKNTVPNAEWITRLQGYFLVIAVSVPTQFQI